MTELRKNETVTFRIDAATLDNIRRAARLKSKSVTSFVTEAASAAADRELLDQKYLRLEPEIFEQIEAILAQPAKVDEQLVKLFKSERDWID